MKGKRNDAATRPRKTITEQGTRKNATTDPVEKKQGWRKKIVRPGNFKTSEGSNTKTREIAASKGKLLKWQQSQSRSPGNRERWDAIREEKKNTADEKHGLKRKGLGELPKEPEKRYYTGVLIAGNSPTRA